MGIPAAMSTRAALIFGDHAARADDASRVPRDAHDALVDAFDALDQVRAFDLRRIRVIEPLDIREDHHKLRLDKARHERRERVVVAKANLLDRHRVVLVHDGHDPHLKQAGKRVARMRDKPCGRQCLAVVKSTRDVVIPCWANARA